MQIYDNSYTHIERPWKLNKMLPNVLNFEIVRSTCIKHQKEEKRKAALQKPEITLQFLQPM